MATIAEMKQRARVMLADQRRLIDSDPRPWSAKKAEFDRLDAEIKSLIAQAEGRRDRPDLLDLGTEYAAVPTSGRSFGLSLAGYRSVAPPELNLDPQQAAALYEAALSRKSFALDTKAAQDSTAITPAAITHYNRVPVTALREPSRVLGLLPTVAIDAPSVTWYSTTGTAAAAPVAEGGVKPTSTLTYVANTTAATKLAHVAEFTDEVMADMPTFMAALQDDMTRGLIKAESNELLNATAAGASKFAGLLNTSGILTYARTTENNLDAVTFAMDQLRNGSSFTEPDGIVLHPSTWGNTKRLKDAQGRYYLQPDPTSGNGLTLWGVPVVLTTQIAPGTALIGNFREATQAYVREGIRLETAVGEAQFKNNTVLVRCEERLILTVPRPSGLLKLTNLS